MTYETKSAFPGEEKGWASSGPETLISNTPEDLLTRSCESLPTRQGNLFWSLKIAEGMYKGRVRPLKTFLRKKLKSPPIQT